MISRKMELQTRLAGCTNVTSSALSAVATVLPAPLRASIVTEHATNIPPPRFLFPTSEGPELLWQNQALWGDEA